jgi:hypothetical protein
VQGVVSLTVSLRLSPCTHVPDEYMYVSLEAEAGRRFLAAVEIEERRDAEMERMSAVPPTASMMTSSVLIRCNQGAGLVTSPMMGITTSLI